MENGDHGFNSSEVARSNQLGDVTVGAMSVSVLHILTSAMALSSTSRLLGENIVSKIEGAKVVIRDVGVSPVPAIDQVICIELKIFVTGAAT